MNVIDTHMLQSALEKRVKEALKAKPHELFTTFDLLISGMAMNPADLNPADVAKIGTMLEGLGYQRCLATVDAGAQMILVEMWKRAGGIVPANKPKLVLVPG